MTQTSTRSPFLVKNLKRDDRFAFMDMRSDFRALMDRDGLAKMRSVFARPAADLTEEERAIASTLVQHGLVGSLEELARTAPPEERTGSLLSRIEIELTKVCNLACKHCFTAKARDRFDVSLLERNLDRFEELGIVEVVLNGGEIFLHEGVARVLEILEGRFKVILYTNGTLDGMVDVVAAARVARVNVSLDGFEESHDHLRGPGTFRRTVETIRTLVARGVRTQVNAVVHDRNIARLEEFIAYCRDDLRACHIKLSTIYPLGGAREHPELFAKSQETLHREVYMRYLKEDLPGLPSETHLPCLAGLTKIYVDAGGVVYPCRLFEGSEYRMGSLVEEPLTDLYRRFVEAPSFFTRFRIEELAACARCPALAACKTGCRARALLSDGDIRAADSFSCRHHL